MSTFSKVLHIGEETISIIGDDNRVSLSISRFSVALSHEEADELVEALMHGRTRSDGFTAADMADAAAQGFRDGQADYVVYAWTVSGTLQMCFGWYVEEDARDEAKRHGGTATPPIPLYVKRTGELA